jgi:thiamine pyrophosphate-dependent acetolactate synthase large subunit-like protein
MKFDAPIAPDPKPAWGSDVAAQMLRRLGYRYVSLNPGASYRGLHDSLVNHLGNESPSMILCLHEDHAVAIAHGYAKASGEPMACVLHSNVGLMHGMMGLYNAFCDRAPMLVLGATGPADAAQRRPWIDWLHTSADQAGMIRDFIKWDDQPLSAEALVESLARADLTTRSLPSAPVYVCLDAGLQERKLGREPAWPDVARLAPPSPPRPAAGDVAKAAALLRGAQRPVLLIGRSGRGEAEWQARIALAERLGALVFTDFKCRAAFPTDHPAHIAPPAVRPTKPARAVLKAADVVLSLDWPDLGGLALEGPLVIHASLDQMLHNGAHMNYQRLAEADLRIAASPDSLVADLVAALGQEKRDPWHAKLARKEKPAGTAIALEDVARALREAVPDPDRVGFAALCRGWPSDLWPLRDPLSYLGKDGGGGIGSGPGLAVGAALAYAEMGRPCVAILGDGDFLMGATALWSAARARIPLLVIVNNNRSYFNDELHQEAVARTRGRSLANRWIGQRLDDPALDIAGLARAQGAVGIGPVTEARALPAAMAQAVAVLRQGGVCVLDVQVTPGEERSAGEIPGRG